MDYKKLYEQTLAENQKLKHDLSLCAEGLIPNDLIQKGIVETCREKVTKIEAENKDLKKKSDAKSDIIKNMMDKIVYDADIDDGFYIAREWGHKYIDEWNDIVTEEFKEVIKDINSQNYEEDDLCLYTRDGYNFDFVLKRVDSDEE